MKKFKEPTSMTRIAMYFIVTLGLGLVELFRAHNQKMLSWSSSVGRMFVKMGIFAFVFIVIEIGYFIYRKINSKKQK